MTETTTQVERVARAMCNQYLKRLFDNETNRDAVVEYEWHDWEGEATAAINAMSEPTMAMLNAAVDATEAGAGMSWVNRSPQKLFQVGYQAMLANALAPQPHTAPIPHEQGRDEVERLREALRYYADEHKNPNEGPWGANSDDFGDRARAALSPPLL